MPLYVCSRYFVNHIQFLMLNTVNPLLRRALHYTTYIP